MRIGHPPVILWYPGKRDYAIASGQVLCTEADDYPSFSKHEAYVLWGRPCPDCKAAV